MKKNILIATALFTALAASAQSEVLIVTLNDGTQASFEVSEIREMTFGTVDSDPATAYAGDYAGTQSVTVGGTFTYSTDLTVKLTAGADGTLNVTIPEYQLEGTVMGDLSLGSVTINGLEYDSDKGGFFRDYAADGISQHFMAVNNGQTTYDKDFVLGAGSTIFVKLDNGKLTIENPFKLGAMPFPMVGAFEGSKK